MAVQMKSEAEILAEVVKDTGFLDLNTELNAGMEIPIHGGGAGRMEYITSSKHTTSKLEFDSWSIHTVFHKLPIPEAKLTLVFSKSHIEDGECAVGALCSEMQGDHSVVVLSDKAYLVFPGIQNRYYDDGAMCRLCAEAGLSCEHPR